MYYYNVVLSHLNQKLILEIHGSPFGIYMSEQKIYSHQRAFYHAVKYLEKCDLVEKIYIPVMNKTRLCLTAQGKMLGFILEGIKEKGGK